MSAIGPIKVEICCLKIMMMFKFISEHSDNFFVSIRYHNQWPKLVNCTMRTPVWKDVKWNWKFGHLYFRLAKKWRISSGDVAPSDIRVQNVKVSWMVSCPKLTVGTIVNVGWSGRSDYRKVCEAISLASSLMSCKRSIAWYVLRSEQKIDCSIER